MLHSKVQPVHAVIFLAVVDLSALSVLFFSSSFLVRVITFISRLVPSFLFRVLLLLPPLPPSLLSKLISPCGSFLSFSVLPYLGLWSCLPEQPDSRPIAGLYRSRRERPRHHFDATGTSSPAFRRWDTQATKQVQQLQHPPVPILPKITVQSHRATSRNRQFAFSSFAPAISNKSPSILPSVHPPQSSLLAVAAPCSCYKFCETCSVHHLLPSASSVSQRETPFFRFAPKSGTLRPEPLQSHDLLIASSLLSCAPQTPFFAFASSTSCFSQFCSIAKSNQVAKEKIRIPRTYTTVSPTSNFRPFKQLLTAFPGEYLTVNSIIIIIITFPPKQSNPRTPAPR
ncbi:uncharacterized protein BDZ83DRAFT_196313 [Colletotrichum acutatum]|uniref:Uncharacterized protein n=1 Tax=Glomerella acutata TaxID=27357 RepID=A0AAD8XGY9_GLOAC|nr:uncharacterized protein BDZ83DRAFT_196313 [Colletotrichum acutatum]KAK1727589.1 hypothetical protein BDZ83DRAFT_196313 [Colletotrichum acutatum]